MKRITPILGLVLVAVALVVMVAGCSGDAGNRGGYGGGGSEGGDTTGTGETGTAANTVNEQGLAFNPATLTVKVGDTVTFVNGDSATHDVEIDGKQLGEHGPGEKVQWTAEKAGSYPYRCTIHPSMTGEIVVE